MTGEINQNKKSEIETKLEELQTQLKQTEDTLKEKSKERDNLKTGITDLEKILNEFKQTAEAYGKACVSFDADKNSLIEYQAANRKIIDRMLGKDEQIEIDKKIQEFDIDKTKKEDVVSTNKKEYDKANTKFEENKKKLDDKLKEIDSLKQSLKARQKEIDDKLKYLKTLKGSIDKTQKDEKFTDMYYWIKEFENGINSLEIRNKDKITDEFNTQLNKLWNDLDDAKSQYDINEKALNETKDIWESSKNELDSLINSRDEMILNKISQINFKNLQKLANSAEQGQNTPSVNPGNPQLPA